MDQVQRRTESSLGSPGSCFTIAVVESIRSLESAWLRSKSAWAFHVTIWISQPGTLAKKGYITRADNSDFSLTAEGVDFIETQRVKIPVLNRLLKTGNVACNVDLEEDNCVSIRRAHYGRAPRYDTHPGSPRECTRTPHGRKRLARGKKERRKGPRRTESKSESIKFETRKRAEGFQSSARFSCMEDLTPWNHIVFSSQY